MPFIAILKELVGSVEGAEGAIIIAADGEAVQWFANGNVEMLRLRAAYVALTARAGKELASNLGLQNRGAMFLKYEGAAFVVAELESGYMLVLAIGPEASVGQAVFKTQAAAQKSLAVL